MNARDLNPNETRGYTNHAQPDSEWITDGAMIAHKGILPKNVLTQWAKEARFVGSRKFDDKVFLAYFPPAPYGDIVAGTAEIPPVYINGRARLVPNGIDWATFDAPCFTALAGLTESVRIGGEKGNSKAVFYVGGKPVALLMGQMP